MRSKLVFGLIATMLVLALAPSSFAQVQIRLFNTGSAGEIQTNRNAQTADVGSLGAGITVTGELVANSPLTTTTLTLTFPSPITSGPAAIAGPGVVIAVPTGDAIRIEGSSGVFAGITAIFTMSYTSGTIQVVLPGFGLAPNTLSGSFRLVGVRVDANGKTAPLTLTSSLSSSANNYFPATETPTLISTLGAGIASLAVGAKTTPTPAPINDGTATIFTNRSVPDLLASFVLGEGFASAWRTSTQNSTQGIPLTGGNATQIKLTFTGVPANLTLTVTCTGSTGLTPIAGPFSITSTANTADVSFSATNLTTVQTLDCRLSLPSPIPTNVTLTPGTITVTATMSPIGDALDPTTAGAINTPFMTGGFPRFAQADVGPLTLVNILAANTTMLLPYASKTGPFDTGIAIANTTADPFGSAGGGFTASTGNLTVTFFPRTATGAGVVSTINTSATVRPGTGLGTDGTLAGGGTWTVNLSELMPVATPALTGDYFGYIFVQANFPAAHGISFIYNGAGFTSFSPLLIMAPPISTPRTTGVFESLGF